MMRIRKFEEKIISFYTLGKLASFPHAYIGEEAVGVGVTANLRDDDWITSTHRAEGHVLAKGSDTNRVMAELFGKSTGVSSGKGGSMHFGDKSKGLLGATGIVSSGIPIATGAGLSSQVRHTDQVAVSFFGDGAVPERRVPREHQPRRDVEPPGDIRLREQPVFHMDAVLQRIQEHGGREPGRRLLDPGSGGRRHGCPGDVQRGQRGCHPGKERRGTDPDRGQDLPVRGALHRRPGHQDEGGEGGMA